MLKLNYINLVMLIFLLQLMQLEWELIWTLITSVLITFISLMEGGSGSSHPLSPVLSLLNRCTASSVHGR